jgi:hypothetical protein
MANFNVITVARKKADLQFNPYVRVCLAHPPDHYKDDRGNIVLSLKLMTDEEIDVAIDGLIEELRKVRQKAKKELQKAKEQNRIFAR